jgi:hypothetical protein
MKRFLVLKSEKILVVPSPALTSLPEANREDVFFYKIESRKLQVSNQLFLSPILKLGPKFFEMS